MAATIRTRSVPTQSISAHARNPRRGDIAAIKDSLEANGQYRPILVNARSGEVLAGNHTLLAARELGWPKILASFVDVDDERARRILLADNRTADLASYDDAALTELLSELPDLEGTGYDDDALGTLLDELDAGSVGEDDPPPLPAKAKTKPGELHALGAHRLLCGDATDPTAYEHLLAGAQAQLFWTDPPYGVDYRGKTKAKLRIQNDAAAGIEALLHDSFAAADAALVPGAALYVAHPTGPLSLTFGNAFVAQGWQLRQTLVWVKDSLVLGRSDYHYRHEPILYGYKPGVARGRGRAGWYGGNAETTVLELPRPKAAREHPTMKPPQLIEIALRNSSRRGALVLDPFAGSGSTLVACERLGRAARLIELDSRYCDVIRSRFERLTGERARRLR